MERSIHFTILNIWWATPNYPIGRLESPQRSRLGRLDVSKIRKLACELSLRESSSPLGLNKGNIILGWDSANSFRRSCSSLLSLAHSSRLNLSCRRAMEDPTMAGWSLLCLPICNTRSSCNVLLLIVVLIHACMSVRIGEECKGYGYYFMVFGQS